LVDDAGEQVVVELARLLPTVGVRFMMAINGGSSTLLHRRIRSAV